jgi:predicted GH43/DUF377 family glycosyl hydrolase
MLLIERAGIVLERTELAFEAKGVLNPAVITFNGQIHMFYRAVSNNMVSTLGHCLLSDPLTIELREQKPVVSPEGPQESMGIEDPRIVKIDQYFFFELHSF